MVLSAFAFFCDLLRTFARSKPVLNRCVFGSVTRTVHATVSLVLPACLSSCWYHYVVGRKRRTMGSSERTEPPCLRMTGRRRLRQRGHREFCRSVAVERGFLFAEQTLDGETSHPFPFPYSSVLRPMHL